MIAVEVGRTAFGRVNVHDFNIARFLIRAFSPESLLAIAGSRTQIPRVAAVRRKMKRAAVLYSAPIRSGRNLGPTIPKGLPQK